LGYGGLREANLQDNIIAFLEQQGSIFPKRKAVPITTEPDEEARDSGVIWRTRQDVQRNIDRHTEVRVAFAKAVAWTAAAEAQDLPLTDIQTAKADVAVLYEE
jgi:hypothetical protein